MQITILTAGSTGDVVPYVALGRGLQAAGHRVRLATHVTFERLIRSYGLEFAPIHGDPQEILRSMEGQAWLQTGVNPALFVRRYIRLLAPLLEQALADAWQASQGSDAIVFSRIGFWAGYHIAEKLSVPSYAAYLQPRNPTRAYAKCMFPALPHWLGPARGTCNLMTHLLSDQVSWQLLRPSVNRARRAVLNLPPLPPGGPSGRMEREHDPVLYGYSPTILPKPAEWGEWVHVTGFWFLDRLSDWRPPPRLAEFLGSGPAPVYIGFGSMSDRSADRGTRLVVEALRQSQQRGILAMGWGGLRDADLPESIIAVESIPHDWLFPRMAAVVHHAGIGTIGAGLRAGIPNISVPFLGDQFFWGQRLAELGVGPTPIPRKQLTAEALAAAIAAAVSNPEMQRRAAAMGELVGAEHGITRAVEAFHQR